MVPGQVHVTLVLTGYCPVRLGGQGVGGAEHPAGSKKECNVST